MTERVFFLQDFDELAWRSPNKHWITYTFRPTNEVDVHTVWNFLQTCPGLIGIKKVHGYIAEYEITFELESSRDKFAMYSKLSGWETPQEGLQIRIEQSLANHATLTKLANVGVPIPRTALRKALGDHGFD